MHDTNTGLELAIARILRDSTASPAERVEALSSQLGDTIVDHFPDEQRSELMRHVLRRMSVIVDVHAERH